MSIFSIAEKKGLSNANDIVSNGPFAASGHMVHAGGQVAHWTSKTKRLHQDKFAFSLFWMSQWAACPPACTM